MADFLVSSRTFRNSKSVKEVKSKLDTLLSFFEGLPPVLFFVLALASVGVVVWFSITRGGKALTQTIATKHLEEKNRPGVLSHSHTSRTVEYHGSRSSEFCAHGGKCFEDLAVDDRINKDYDM